MENKDIPYIVYESSIAREERHSKRLIIVIILLISVWLMTIALFVWYISLPIDESTTTQTVEDIEDGDITQIGGDDYGQSNPDGE